jgi:hypothetical protein
MAVKENKLFALLDKADAWQADWRKPIFLGRAGRGEMIWLPQLQQNSGCSPLRRAVLYSPPPVLVDSVQTPQIRTESARSPQIHAESVQSPCRVHKESTRTPQTQSKEKCTESVWTPR